MKTTILLLVLIFGYIAPTYSQLNRQRQIEGTIERFQNKTPDQFPNKKNDDFSSYKFADKFGGLWSYRMPDSFDRSPVRPAPNRFPNEIYTRYGMPCFHPKSGDPMPC